MSDIKRTIIPNDPADFTPTREPQIPLQPFRYWCQKVLPLVYDDSLSYYEMLCKAVDYLNKTMVNVNILITDFEELQSYVNHYFDNLDVQEEINNKLDELVESGKLDVMFNKYIPYVTPEQFGAKGDGVSNDTSAFQSAVNTLKPVMLKNKYLIDTITLPSYSTIIGNNSTLICNNDYALITADKANNISISDLFIIGNNLGSGIHLYASENLDIDSNITLKNIECYQVKNGILIDLYMRGCMLTNIRITWATNNGLIINCTDSFIDNCNVGNCNKTGVLLNGSNNRLTNFASYWNGKDGNAYYNIEIRGNYNLIDNFTSQDSFFNSIYLSGNNNSITAELDSNNRQNYENSSLITILGMYNNLFVNVTDGRNNFINNVMLNLLDGSSNNIINATVYKWGNSKMVYTSGDTSKDIIIINGKPLNNSLNVNGNLQSPVGTISKQLLSVQDNIINYNIDITLDREIKPFTAIISDLITGSIGTPILIRNSTNNTVLFAYINGSEIISSSTLTPGDYRMDFSYVKK